MSTITLTDQDKITLRTAAYGAVALVAAAGATGGSPHKAATRGSVALCSATGTVGHVLSEKKRDVNVYGKSVAALADQVLPALSASMHLLGQQDPAEATNFATTVTIAIDAAAQPGPATAEMTRKITAALAA